MARPDGQCLFQFAVPLRAEIRLERLDRGHSSVPEPGSATRPHLPPQGEWGRPGQVRPTHARGQQRQEPSGREIRRLFAKVRVGYKMTL